MGSSIIIKVENVSKIYYPAITALRNVSFEIEEGEFVSIVGKSGAGKTTLARLILALDEPSSGRVYFKGIDLNLANEQEIQDLRRTVGAIYQDYRLFNKKTVFENLSYLLEVAGISEREIKKRVFDVLDLMGLTDKSDNFPFQLSSGEQQRLAIARALVISPQVIIADEPTGNLDPYHTHEVISLLKKMNEEGKTVILLTHNREIVNRVKKRVITLVEGKVIRDEKEGKFII